MRIIGLFVTAVLGVLVVAEGGYIMKTRRQMDALEARIERLAETAPKADDEDRPARAGWSDRPAAEPEADDDQGRRAPPPRFVVPPQPTHAAAEPANSGDPLPMPPGLDSPEAREQLRQFIAAQLARQREEERQKQNQRRDEAEQQRRDEIAKKLGLGADDGKRLTEILTTMQTAMRETREKIDSGALPRDQAGRAFQEARERQDQQLRSLLGDDRMKQFQEMQRTSGGGGPGGGWGGRPPRFGGGDFGGQGRPPG